MLTTLADDIVTRLLEIDELTDINCKRGEFGKVNTIGSKGVLVMIDFKPPVPFGEGDGTLPKQIPVTANLFVQGAHTKGIKSAEDVAFTLSTEVINKMAESDFRIITNSNHKYFNWEFTDIEWIERSASSSVIALEFTMNYQV